MRRVLWATAGAVAALALVLSAGCGQGGFSERTKQAESTAFRYPIPATPTTFDPASVRDGDTIDLLQQMYECLVEWGPDGNPQPLLAQSWSVEDGGKTFVFTLKEGVKFHSGRAMTAEDVKKSIERNARVKGSSMASGYLSDIVGLKDYSERAKAGDVDPKGVPGIEVRDPKTVVFRLNQPTPYFLGKLTYLVASVVDVEKAPEGTDMTQLDQMVGTGPFKIASYEPQQVVVLEANPDYHGGSPKIQRIERPIILDAVTRLNKYKAGELDLVQLERQDVPALQADAEYKDQVKFFDRPAIWYLAMNPQRYKPFEDVRVRQAFAMAVDKNKIVNELMGGINTVATGIVPKGVPGHREDAGAFPFDVARAKALLAEAGYPNGQGLPEVELAFREGRPDIKLVSEAVLNQLKENLGVGVRLREMEWQALLNRQEKGDLQMYHMRWAADYLDPQNFLSFMFASWGPENYFGWKNEEFDALCRQADSIMDMEARLPLYAKAEDIVLREALWAPIYYQRDAELHAPGLKGLRESPAGHLPHTQVTVERS